MSTCTVYIACYSNDTRNIRKDTQEMPRRKATEISHEEISQLEVALFGCLQTILVFISLSSVQMQRLGV